MRACSLQDAEPAAGVAEADDVLVQQPRARRRAVGLGQLPREEGGNPEPPEQVPHGGLLPNFRYEFVFFRS